MFVARSSHPFLPPPSLPSFPFPLSVPPRGYWLVIYKMLVQRNIIMQTALSKQRLCCLRYSDSTCDLRLSITRWTDGHQSDTDRVLLWRQHQLDWSNSQVQSVLPVQLWSRRRRSSPDHQLKQPACNAARALFGWQTQQSGKRLDFYEPCNFKFDVTVYVVAVTYFQLTALNYLLSR